MNLLYMIAYVVVWVLAHLLLRIRVEGRENMVRNRGIVICSNHLSVLDPVLLSVVWKGGWPFFTIMGKEELFRKPFLAWFFGCMGCFPVNRGAADTAALDKAIAGVKNGRALLIYPEGTRSKTGALGKLKSGAFVVAAAAGTAIVPVVMEYSKPRHILCTVTIRVGPAIPPEALALPETHRTAGVRRARARLLDSFVALGAVVQPPETKNEDAPQATPEAPGPTIDETPGAVSSQIDTKAEMAKNREFAPAEEGESTPCREDEPQAGPAPEDK